MKRILIWLLFIVSLSFSAEAKQYSFQGLTGTGTYPAVANLALDGWPVLGDLGPPVASPLTDGAFAYGRDGSGNYYTFVYDSASSAAEDVPNVITPNDSTGAGRWIKLGLGLVDYMQLQPSTGPAHSEALFYYDSTKNALTYYNEEADVAVNTGQEILIPVYNNTVSTIPNGAIVYPIGIDIGSGRTTIDLADASDKTKCRLIGMATHSIEASTAGYVTRLGSVGGLNTAGLSGILYLSATNPGEFTDVVPDDGGYATPIGAVGIQDVSVGTIIVDPVIALLTVEVTDTNGFPTSQRTNTTMSFVDGTRTFSIAPVSGSFHYYILGDKYNVDSSDSVVITDIEGIHAIYYNNDTLTVIANPSEAQKDDLIKTKALVSFIYWDAVNSVASYFADERHGISMSPETHSYLNSTRGAQYINGIAPGDFSSDGTGNDNVDAQFSIITGLIADEDLLITNPTVSSTTGLPIYYLSGANADLRRVVQTGYPVYVTGSAAGRPYYNEWTGSIWQLTEMGSNSYILMHVFSLNGYTGEDIQISIMGQNEYINVIAARTGANQEIADILIQFPFEEIVPIGSVIFQSITTYTNAVKARIRTTDTGEDYVDWRTSEIAQGSAPSSHSNLTNLEKSGLGVNFGHIDDQAQTIAGDKTFSGTIEIGNILISLALPADGDFQGYGYSNKNAGETIAKWDHVYLDATTDEWMIADSDVVGKWPSWGIAKTAGTDGNPLIVWYRGTGRNDTWAWTPKAPLYLDDVTGGGMTETAPATSGDCVQPVGVAITADEVDFNVDHIFNYMEVE